MAGIGKYKKGEAFKLKSGNAPAFKMMAGESPITSPYKEDADEKGNGKGLKNALMIGASALTGGLDAVYGSGKITSMSGRLKKKGDPKPCPEGQARNNDGECVDTEESEE